MAKFKLFGKIAAKLRRIVGNVRTGAIAIAAAFGIVAGSGAASAASPARDTPYQPTPVHTAGAPSLVAPHPALPSANVQQQIGGRYTPVVEAVVSRSPRPGLAGRIVYLTDKYETIEIVGDQARPIDVRDCVLNGKAIDEKFFRDVAGFNEAKIQQVRSNFLGPRIWTWDARGEFHSIPVTDEHAAVARPTALVASPVPAGGQQRYGSFGDAVRVAHEGLSEAVLSGTREVQLDGNRYLVSPYGGRPGLLGVQFDGRIIHVVPGAGGSLEIFRDCEYGTFEAIYDGGKLHIHMHGKKPSKHELSLAATEMGNAVRAVAGAFSVSGVFAPLSITDITFGDYNTPLAVVLAERPVQTVVPATQKPAVVAVKPVPPAPGPAVVARPVVPVLRTVAVAAPPAMCTPVCPDYSDRLDQLQKDNAALLGQLKAEEQANREAIAAAIREVAEAKAAMAAAAKDAVTAAMKESVAPFLEQLKQQEQQRDKWFWQRWFTSSSGEQEGATQIAGRTAPNVSAVAAVSAAAFAFVRPKHPEDHALERGKEVLRASPAEIPSPPPTTLYEAWVAAEEAITSHRNARDNVAAIVDVKVALENLRIAAVAVFAGREGKTVALGDELKMSANDAAGWAAGYILDHAHKLQIPLKGEMGLWSIVRQAADRTEDAGLKSQFEEFASRRPQSLGTVTQNDRLLRLSA